MLPKTVYNFLYSFFLVFFQYIYKYFKDVSKIIGIGYNITFIKGGTVGTLGATAFNKRRDLIAFAVLLILFQFLSKYVS